MTNLGPLTTTFTPIGPNCSSTFIGQNGGSLWVQYGAGGDAASACLPKFFNHSEDYYYSPGICPLGYTSACSSRVFLPARSASETVVTCCPSGYLGNNNRGRGFNFLTDSDGVTTYIGTGVASLTLYNPCFYAFAPIVRMVAGDIPRSTATSTDVGLMNASRSDGGAGPDNTGRGADEDIKQSPRIGVAVGVGLSVGLGKTLLSGAIVLLIRLYRKRLRSSQVPDLYMPDLYKPERCSMAPLPYQQHAPGHQEFPYELSAEREPGELSAEREPGN